MFKIMYRLNLLNQETDQHYPIHLCRFKGNQPSFKDLLEKIQSVTEVNIEDYEIVHVNHHHQHSVIQDDSSLCHALTSLAVKSTLSLLLRLKSKDNPYKRQCMADTRELPNPLELIHPLEPKRTLPTLASITQHPYPTHFELAPIRPIPLRKRRKRASVELQSMFLCEHPIGRDICGQTFRRSYDLSRHQTIHLKNRPFCYCHQCGKKFTRMDALRRHERVQSHSSSKHRSMSTSALPSSS